MADQQKVISELSPRDVLYRKYRSQTFDELVGQGHITEILKNAVKSGAVSHAYLFVGSRGTGKTSTARILAKALNCKNLRPDGNPCNECTSCLSITAGTHLDIIEIDAASNRGIDQIRELKERLEFAPTEGRYKIYIIDEVHMLTTEAFNALLKTLEEPPKHVIFMLATTDVHKLPATILSRCQRYDFRLGNKTQIQDVLVAAADREGVKLTEEAMQLLIENAHGSYRDLLSLLDVVVSGQVDSENPNEVSASEVRNMLGIPDATMVFHLLDNLFTGNSIGALDLIDEIGSRGINMQQFVKYILAALRELLVLQMKGEEHQFSHEVSQRDVLRYINLFLDAERKLRYTHIPEMILEMVVAEISMENKSTASNGSKVVKPINNNEKQAAKPVEISQSSKKVESVDKVENKDSSELVKEATAKSEVGRLEDNKSDIEKNIDRSGESEFNLQMDDLAKKWDGLLQSVQTLNGHLYGFLKCARLSEIKEGFLTLQVPFQFHKDRIESPKTRELLGDLFKSVYGVNVPLKCEVDSSIKSKKKVAADVILKNIPVSEPPKSSEEKKTAPSSFDKSKSYSDVKKPRAIDKKIEAIFEGM